MMLRSCLCVLAASICALAGCSPRQISVASQKQSNWLDVDPAALSTADPGPPPKILPETHFAAALLLEAQRQYTPAIAQYHRATLLNHEYLAAYHRLGVLLGHVGRHLEATAALERAVTLRPDVAILHNNLGYEYALQERWEEAEAALRYAIDLQPDFARAHINLAMVLCQLDRFDEGYEAFSAVLPEAEVHYNLGLMYRGRQRDTEAALAFIRALEFDPGLIAASKQLDGIMESLGPLWLTDPLVEIVEAPEEFAEEPEDSLPFDADEPCADEEDEPIGWASPTFVGDDGFPEENFYEDEPVAGTVDGVVYASELMSAEELTGTIVEEEDAFMGPPAEAQTEQAADPDAPADLGFAYDNWLLDPPDTGRIDGVVDETVEFEVAVEDVFRLPPFTNTTEIATPVDDLEWFATDPELEAAWRELIMNIEMQHAGTLGRARLSDERVGQGPTYPAGAAPAGDATVFSHPPISLLDPMQTVQSEDATAVEGPPLPSTRTRPVRHLENPTPQP